MSAVGTRDASKPNEIHGVDTAACGFCQGATRIAAALYTTTSIEPIRGRAVDSRLGCIWEEKVTSQLGLFLTAVVVISTAACSGVSLATKVDDED